MPYPTGAALVDDKWRLRNQARQLGRSLTGRQQVVANMTPLWQAEITLRVPRVGNSHFECEAWIEGMRDGAVVDQILPGTERMSFASGGVTYDGGVTFDGGVTYDSEASVALTAAATQFASSITVDVGSALTVGKFIWIAGWMYRVQSIAGNTIGILPGLRAAAAIGEAVIGRSTIAMSFASAETADLRRSVAGFYDVTVQLIEDLG